MKASPGVAYAFWARAEQIRADKGWTQAELCERSGVRRQAYANLRIQRRKPQTRIVLAVASAIGVPDDEAKVLAGLAHGDIDIVRRSIVAAKEFTPLQRDAMLAVLEVMNHEYPAAPAAQAEAQDAQQTDVVVALLAVFNQHRRPRRRQKPAAPAVMPPPAIPQPVLRSVARTA